MVSLRKYIDASVTHGLGRCGFVLFCYRFFVLKVFSNYVMSICDAMCLCSDRHISVVADTVICHLTSEEVVKYIMESDVGDMRSKPLSEAVGVCLFQANYASWCANNHSDVVYVKRFFTYVDTIQERRYSHIELFKAVNGFYAQCELNSSLISTPTSMLLSQLCNTLLVKISPTHQEWADEYAKADTWLIP